MSENANKTVLRTASIHSDTAAELMGEVQRRRGNRRFQRGDGPSTADVVEDAWAYYKAAGCPDLSKKSENLVRPPGERDVPLGTSGISAQIHTLSRIIEIAIEARAALVLGVSDDDEEATGDGESGSDPGQKTPTNGHG